MQGITNSTTNWGSKRRWNLREVSRRRRRWRAGHDSLTSTLLSSQLFVSDRLCALSPVCCYCCLVLFLFKSFLKKLFSSVFVTFSSWFFCPSSYYLFMQSDVVRHLEQVLFPVHEGPRVGTQHSQDTATYDHWSPADAPSLHGCLWETKKSCHGDCLGSQVVAGGHGRQPAGLHANTNPANHSIKPSRTKHTWYQEHSE